MNSFIFNWSVIKSSPLTQSETEQFTDHLFTLTSQLQSSLTVDLLMWQTVEVMRVLLFNLISSRRETTDLLLCSQPDAEWFRKQRAGLTRLCLVFIKKIMVRRLESCELHSKSRQFTLQFLFFFSWAQKINAVCINLFRHHRAVRLVNIWLKESESLKNITTEKHFASAQLGSVLYEVITEFLCTWLHILTANGYVNVIYPSVVSRSVK